MGKAEAAFEPTHRLGDVPLEEGEPAEAEIPQHTAAGVLDGLGQLESFGAHGGALGERADLSQAQDQKDPRVHGRQPHQAKALPAQLACERRDTPSVVRDGLLVIAQGVGERAQVVEGPDLQDPIPQGLGQGPLTGRQGLLRIAQPHEQRGQMGGGPPEPSPVPQGLGEGFGLAQVGENASKVAKHNEGRAQVEPDIDGLLVRVVTVGQMPQGQEGMLIGDHRLPIGRLRCRAQASLPAVPQGLVPHLSPHGMVGQAFDLLGHAVSGERLQGLDNAGMQHPASPLQQQTAVGHLVRQGMLEGVLGLGEQAGLIQELCRLEVRQAAVEHGLGHVRNGLEQGEGHVRANHGGGLEQAFLLRRQPVEARRQHGLHRRRDLNARQRLSQTIGPRRTHQHPALHQAQ